MSTYFNILPLEILEIIYIFSAEDINYLDLLEIPPFGRIKFTPYLTGRLFEFYELEILNKNVLLYVLNHGPTVFKFLNYSSNILINMLMGEFNKIKSSITSFEEIFQNNFYLTVTFDQFPNVEFLYDYITSGKEYIMQYIDSTWFTPADIIFDDNDRQILHSNKSDYSLVIEKKGNNFKFKVYLNDDGRLSLQGNIVVNNPYQFIRRLLIHLLYNRIIFKIKIN